MMHQISIRGKCRYGRVAFGPARPGRRNNERALTVRFAALSTPYENRQKHQSASISPGPEPKSTGRGEPGQASFERPHQPFFSRISSAVRRRIDVDCVLTRPFARPRTSKTRRSELLDTTMPGTSRPTRRLLEGYRQAGRSHRILFATSPATPFIQVWPSASALAMRASAEPIGQARLSALFQSRWGVDRHRAGFTLISIQPWPVWRLRRRFQPKQSFNRHAHVHFSAFPQRNRRVRCDIESGLAVFMPK